MNNAYSISVFLQKMVDLNRQLEEGVPHTSILTQIIQNISIFIGCNQDEHDVRLFLQLMRRMVSELAIDLHQDSSFPMEFLVQIASLEKYLRGSGEPIDIIRACLKKILQFYQADGVVIIETNMNSMTGQVVVEESLDGTMFLQEQKAIHFDKDSFPVLYNAITSNQTTNVDVQSDLLDDSEIEILQSFGIQFASIAPFQKRKSGYVLLKNPHRWTGCNEFLQALSYVIVSELNEINMLNDLALADEKDLEFDEHDIYITSFGPLEIETKYAEAASPKVTTIPFRILTYMTLNRRRSVSQDELIEAIWGDSIGYAGTTNNLKTALHRAREIMNDVYPYPFIIVDGANRLRISPDVNMHLDTELFEAYYAKGSRMGSSNQEKIKNLMKAYSIYRGNLMEGNNIDDWVAFRRTHYVIRFMNLILDLLPLLFEEQMYSDLFSVAAKGLSYEAENGTFHYYYLQSMIHQGLKDLAQKHFSECRKYLRKDDLTTISLLMKTM